MLVLGFVRELVFLYLERNGFPSDDISVVLLVFFAILCLNVFISISFVSLNIFRVDIIVYRIICSNIA